MYLSPLTWGTNDMLVDFHQQSVPSKQVKNVREKRIKLAKERHDEPIFIKIVHEIASVHPPMPYFLNPLAESFLRSDLGCYVRNHFKWKDFPVDVDIGKGKRAMLTNNHSYIYSHK